MWGFAVIVSFLADQAISKNLLRTGIVRRISNTIAHSGTAFCLIGICFTGCNQTATIVLLTLAITMQGALYSGFFTNPLDIAPNFAGTILGITNAIGTIPGWLAPLLAGAFTKEKVKGEQKNTGTLFVILSMFLIYEKKSFLYHQNDHIHSFQN